MALSSPAILEPQALAELTGDWGSPLIIGVI